MTIHHALSEALDKYGQTDEPKWKINQSVLEMLNDIETRYTNRDHTRKFETLQGIFKGKPHDLTQEVYMSIEMQKVRISREILKRFRSKILRETTVKEFASSKFAMLRRRFSRI